MQLVLAKRGQSHQRVLPLLTGSLLHRGPPQDDAVRLAVTTGGRLERPRISSIPPFTGSVGLERSIRAAKSEEEEESPWSPPKKYPRSDTRLFPRKNRSGRRSSMKAVAAATRVATAPFARRDTFKGPVSCGPSSQVVGPVASVKTNRTGNMAKKPNVAAWMLSLGMSSSRGDESGKLRAVIDPDAAVAATNASTVTAGDMWRLAQEKRSAATALSKFAATCQVFSTFAQLSAAHQVEEAWREVEDAEEAARTFLAQETAPQNPDV